MTEVELLLAEAEEATALHDRAREQARKEVVRALREVERRCLSMLKGVPFKGMENLMPFGSPFYAARLRGDLDEPLPEDGREVLCMSAHGQIVLVGRDVENYDGGVMKPKVAPARDEDLQAQDLSGALGNLVEVLRRHCARVGKSTPRYRDIEDLAFRVSSALGI